MIPAPPAPPPPPPPGRRKRTRLIIVLVVAALVVIGGGLATALIMVRANSPASAQVGDCLSFDRAREDLRRAECASSTATHRLIGFANSAGDCAEIPGATQAVPGKERTYCLAKVDADLTTAINTVKAGDCVTVTGDEAVKSGCVKNSYPVLAVLRKEIRASQSDLNVKCIGVEGTQNAYGWSISADPKIPVGTWDRILCLGAKK